MYEEGRLLFLPSSAQFPSKTKTNYLFPEPNDTIFYFHLIFVHTGSHAPAVFNGKMKPVKRTNQIPMINPAMIHWLVLMGAFVFECMILILKFYPKNSTIRRWNDCCIFQSKMILQFLHRTKGGRPFYFEG